ncbi:MAG: type II toxin-antitoxin system Phd/YefM family antitoxin [Ignavibacteriae bacterium]|nr:type II toxin-antitoxin system Phd/YefM family antitoxin [Ignavibacteriota bacterium]
MSNYWQVQQAKAKFSRLMERAMKHGPQFITKHGRAAVVVLSAAEYQSAGNADGTLVEFFQRSPLRGSGLKFDPGFDLHLQNLYTASCKAPSAYKSQHSSVSWRPRSRSCMRRASSDQLISGGIPLSPQEKSVAGS